MPIGYNYKHIYTLYMFLLVGHSCYKYIFSNELAKQANILTNYYYFSY